MSDHEILIVGAGKQGEIQSAIACTNINFASGISGICFARFFLDIHPECRLAILEQDGSLGGVWSSGR